MVKIEQGHIRQGCQEISTGVLKDQVFFMPPFFPFGNVGELQNRCCRGLAVAGYGFPPGALALKLSDVCNDRLEPDKGNSP